MGPAVNMIDEARSFARKDWKICYAAWLYTSRGISIWKIGRASIGMEISSVTEPTIINLGKQCAETKEYFFFFYSSPSRFQQCSNAPREGANFEPRVSTSSKEQNTIPYFPPFFIFFFLCLPFSLPSSSFLFPPAATAGGFSFVRQNLCSTAHKSWKAGTVRNPW